jgi:hypothetical protein
MFKKKKEKLFFVNTSQTTIDQYPIQRATKYIPKWMAAEMKKYRSSNSPENTTISRCPGIIDLYRNGLVVPSSCQLDIHFNGLDIGWDIPDGGHHSCSLSVIEPSKDYPQPVMAEGYYPCAIRFSNHWMVFSTKKDLKILLNEFPYADDKKVRTYPGITDLRLNNELNSISMVSNQEPILSLPDNYPISFLTLLNYEVSEMDIEFVKVPHEAMAEFREEDMAHRYHHTEKYRFYQKLRSTREKLVDRFMKEYLL